MRLLCILLVFVFTLTSLPLAAGMCVETGAGKIESRCDDKGNIAADTDHCPCCAEQPQNMFPSFYQSFLTKQLGKLLPAFETSVSSRNVAPLLEPPIV